MNFDDFEIGDEVLLPFDEEGTVVNKRLYLWADKIYVRITKPTLSDYNEITDFLPERILGKRIKTRDLESLPSMKNAIINTKEKE